MQARAITIQPRRVSVRTAKPDDSLPECRICLSPQQPDNKLISPCGCTGSVRFIHTQCFHSWIRKKAEDPLQREQILSPQGINCEICHEQYRYSFELVTKLATCETFRQKLRARRFLAVATLLFIMIDLALAAVMLNFAVYDQENPHYDIRLPRFFLVYVALGFAILATLYGIKEFAKLFLLHHSFELIAEGQMSRGRPKMKIVRSGSTETGNFTETMHQSHMRMQASGHLVQYI